MKKINTQQGTSNENNGIILYLNEINKIPLLSLEEEQELGYRLLQDDEDAKRVMIESNLRLVVSIACNYVGKSSSLDELIQEGNMGLMRAIERFDVRMGFKFATYATYWIRQAIERFLTEKSRNIHIPTSIYEKIMQ